MLKSILKKFKDKEITIKEFNNFLESSGNFDDLNNIQQIIFSKVLYNIFSYYAKDIDTKNIIYIMAVTRRVITNFKDDELNQNELVNSIVNTLINVFDSFSNKKKYIFKMKYFFFLKRGKTKVHDFDFEAETMFFLSEIIYIELLYKNFPLKYYIYTSCNNVRDEKRKEILQQIFTEKNYIQKKIIFYHLKNFATVSLL